VAIRKLTFGQLAIVFLNVFTVGGTFWNTVFLADICCTLSNFVCAGTFLQIRSHIQHNPMIYGIPNINLQEYMETL